MSVEQRPYRTSISHEIVFAVFYRTHLWSVHILEVWQDNEGNTHQSLHVYDVHWHRGGMYTVEWVGGGSSHGDPSPFPFHPSAAYGLPAQYWVKEGWSVTPYEGSAPLDVLPPWVYALFFDEQRSLDHP